MKRYFSFLFLLGVLLFFGSCKKEAGYGGNSTIYGKIIAHDYNAEFTELKGIYDAADEDVFIIYGDDRSFSERIRTNFDGMYEFKYLRPGNYTIYAYSKDSTLLLPSGITTVIRKVEITDKKQSVKAEDMIIIK
ncbi:MAG: hypothetical protein ACOYMF_00465 [Bacteroidales bacterium]